MFIGMYMQVVSSALFNLLFRNSAIALFPAAGLGSFSDWITEGILLLPLLVETYVLKESRL